MRFWRMVLVGAIASSLPGTTAAADIKIIVNPSVKVSGITVEDLRRVFLLLKSTVDGGVRVEPVLLRAGPVHQTFLRDYMGRTGPALETYYRSLLFSGKASVPQTCANDAEMISYVASTKGAIGYVSASAASDRVRTVEIKEP
jgi:hypothetical protein